MMPAAARSEVGNCKGASPSEVKEVSQTFASWNQVHGWLQRLKALRLAA
jgi:hypothetical protein